MTDRGVKPKAVRSLAASRFTSLALLLMQPLPAMAAECLSAGPDAPMQVTADCTDPLYNAGNFKVLSVTPASASQAYTKVLAEFTGTPYQVNLYLPPQEAWQRRFFQHVYPLQRIDASPGDIGFAMASGGYLVNTNGTPNGDAGYRVDAAAAKLAKEYATKFYGWAKPIYGYIWGGSGGSFQTIGAMENTFGVWNGAVPYVIANEASFLNYQALSALIELALKNKLSALAEAVSPGGSGNPRALLDADERAIFDEAIKMGFPVKGFEFLAHRTSDVLVNDTGRPAEVPPAIGMPYLLADSVRTNDPAYVEDFWSQPGYEGANPPRYLLAAKVDHFATITDMERDAAGVPTSVSLDRTPQLGTTGAIGMENWVYGPDGKTRLAGLLKGDSDETSTRLVLAGNNDPALLRMLTVGGKIRINNRMMLAMVFYHRHSIPGSREFNTYAQYRGAGGKPLYPQRAFSASNWSARRTSGGGSQTGKITGKVIVVGNLLDISAYPYNADGYAARVRRALGEKGFRDNFQLWFNDKANHIDRPPTGPDVPRLVTYVPMLYQALRDLSAWVERGVAPPPSTRYQVVDGQVELPESAADRGGIQPVVRLTVNSADSAAVAVNAAVTFKGEIEIPPGTGKVVATEWYLGGNPVAFEPSPFTRSDRGASVTKTVAFSKPGTYFITLRAKSQRDGNPSDPATLENIDRVRVVVR